MQVLRIEGGRSLSGDIFVGGAKNAATPIIAATMLTDQTCEISNVPRIADVEHMLMILEELGAKVEWKAEHTVAITCVRIDPDRMPLKLVKQLRSSVLLIGPILARCREITIPAPGGCQIGARPLDAHLRALVDVGAQISYENDVYTIRAPKVFSGESVFLCEMSVTATENTLLACVGAKGTTTIRNAASEPHVQDLVKFLRAMGVVVHGEGTSTLTVEGKASPADCRGASHTLIPDPIEAGTFIALAAATRSHLRIHNVVPEFLDMELATCKRIGVALRIVEERDHAWYRACTVLVEPSVRLRAVKSVHNMPYPGFNPDLLQPFSVLMTQAEGTTLVHDWMYEGRFKYVDALIRMGADVVVCDPHRILITGPTPLYGVEAQMTDLRAGATLVIAALLATGTSHISNAEQISRGYERLDDRLRAIGAHITRETNA